eukprot:m.95627 g.95627  ORF g.95627 m.95627 type:complete len:141 (+) comp36859_c0_seq15:45-467(+)
MVCSEAAVCAVLSRNGLEVSNMRQALALINPSARRLGVFQGCFTVVSAPRESIAISCTFSRLRDKIPLGGNREAAVSVSGLTTATGKGNAVDAPGRSHGITAGIRKREGDRKAEKEDITGLINIGRKVENDGNGKENAVI